MPYNKEQQKQYRKCKKCGLEKSLDNFYKIKKESKYRRHTCKQCALIDKLLWKKTEKGKIVNKRYGHTEKRNQINRVYTRRWNKEHPELRKLNRKKSNLKRKRQLGFNPLNKKTSGTVAHHINDIDVVYIPEEIHLKCNGHPRDIHRILVKEELLKIGINIDLLLV